MSTENTTEVLEEKKENKYAILMETSGEESESWMCFIRYNGNEQSLQHLSKQLDLVEWHIVDGYSTFDLELGYLVSEQTAKEMTKVDLNAYSFHRKFDGNLKKIDLGFREKDKNEKKIKKAFKVLGYGKIEEFIDQEDVDPEDLVTQTESESDSETDSESDSYSSSSDEEDNKKKGKLPNTSKNKIEIPRIAKMRQNKHKNKK